MIKNIQSQRLLMVDKTWNYKESLYFIDAVKKHYEDIMLSFSVYGKNQEKRNKIREIKKDIYKLNFEQWKKDKLWEYIVDDIEYTELWKFA